MVIDFVSPFKSIIFLASLLFLFFCYIDNNFSLLNVFKSRLKGEKHTHKVYILIIKGQPASIRVVIANNTRFTKRFFLFFRQSVHSHFALTSIFFQNFSKSKIYAFFFLRYLLTLPLHLWASKPTRSCRQARMLLILMITLIQQPHLISLSPNLFFLTPQNNTWKFMVISASPPIFS